MAQCCSKGRSRKPLQREQVDHFTVLPPELAGITFGHASAVDVLCLRQTCRYSCDCSGQAYQRRWIVERPFVPLNRHRLEMLTSLVNDPERRRQLKCISFTLPALVETGYDFKVRNGFQSSPLLAWRR